MTEFIKSLAQKTSLSHKQIENTLLLLEEGATIPFIARYRKEMTGGASDEILREFEEHYITLKKMFDRHQEIVKILAEKSLLSEKIKSALQQAKTITELEDIYRPFKEKKNTRASIAITQGLEPLANTLQSMRLTLDELNREAKKFIKDDLKSVDAVLKGAQDIIAERFSDSAKEREVVRDIMLRHGLLEVKATKTFNEKGVFEKYKTYSEKISHVPSHRYLAIMRGVSEKELGCKISIDTERYFETIYRYKFKKDANSSKVLLFDAYKDGFKRLLYPSLEREVHHILKIQSDRTAITTFGKNLTQLLMTPPVTQKVLLGVDPAFRTGCKLAVIDENGTFLDHDVIYPTEPKNDYEGSKRVILSLVEKYNITGVAIGNGTASRETQAFFAKLNKSHSRPLKYTVVSEAGASVYSASKLASKEYPDLDVTVRGAISIAGRLRDPMATLVKIDPKSLGIGQYQHDVDQKLLEKKLSENVEALVNRVGVDVNSASASLLSYVAGVGTKLAENIVAYRAENGAFKSKSELLKVKGLGKKAYEQLAGFIRIREGQSLFDNTGIHPESYDIAKKFTAYRDKSDIEAIAKVLDVGRETLEDIVKELDKPGFDPRSELPAIPFRDDVTDIKALKEGAIVSGVVRNIADFGAFVDIGLKNDGMIHISKMSDKRISHPLEVLSINQYLPRIEVISIDQERGKVGLGL
ncbi:MAG: RNA-binding transcriptional accessory protein [Epsilonproteobacteria bacterium]|nr:RNA-binding transcriptional accessory protein [Campylobacterota bacterium]